MVFECEECGEIHMDDCGLMSKAKMKDMINKKKLIEWLDNEMKSNFIYSDTKQKYFKTGKREAFLETIAFLRGNSKGK